MIFVIIAHIYPEFSKHDGATNHVQVEDSAKEPMGKGKRPFQIERIHDICIHLDIFTTILNARWFAKPFSNRRYCQTTDGETEKPISNRRY